MGDLTLRSPFFLSRLALLGLCCLSAACCLPSPSGYSDSPKPKESKREEPVRKEFIADPGRQAGNASPWVKVTNLELFRGNDGQTYATAWVTNNSPTEWITKIKVDFVENGRSIWVEDVAYSYALRPGESIDFTAGPLQTSGRSSVSTKVSDAQYQR